MSRRLNVWMRNRFTLACCCSLLGTAIAAQFAEAGDLEPSAPPSAGTMKTLDELHDRIDLSVPSWSRLLSASDRFEIVLGEAAVLDRETGLVWERNPSSGVVLGNWADAEERCMRLRLGPIENQRLGWRLPTIAELTSLLVGTDSAAPASLPAGHPFADIATSPYYWTASYQPYSLEPASFWSYRFGDGDFSNRGTSGDGRAWCVRSGATIADH